MKKIITLLLMAAVAIIATAQSNGMEVFANVPDGYQPAMNKKIISRKTPCNQGPEAFMDFIPKFRKNATFRKSRIAIPAEDEIGNSSAAFFGAWEIIKAEKGIENGAQFFGTWYDVRPDSVCFHFEEWNIDPETDWGGSSGFFRFQRIDGKWYLTGIMVAG